LKKKADEAHMEIRPISPSRVEQLNQIAFPDGFK
jgi:hypothetical protein